MNDGGVGDWQGEFEDECCVGLEFDLPMVYFISARRKLSSGNQVYVVRRRRQMLEVGVGDFYIEGNVDTGACRRHNRPFATADTGCKQQRQHPPDRCSSHACILEHSRHNGEKLPISSALLDQLSETSTAARVVTLALALAAAARLIPRLTGCTLED
jgi:hypothetical protein